MKRLTRVFLCLLAALCFLLPAAGCRREPREIPDPPVAVAPKKGQSTDAAEENNDGAAELAVDIDSVTRLSHAGNCLLFTGQAGTYHLYRQTDEEPFLHLAATNAGHYYDWTAAEGHIYRYFVTDREIDDIPENKVRPEGYRARAVTNVAILMYHYFSTPEDAANGGYTASPDSPTGTIGAHEIQADLAYFASHNIRTITCSELIAFWRGEIELPERCVMISVDDGHYSVYKYLYPLLAQYHCRANVSLIGEQMRAEPRTKEEADAPCRINDWLTWGEVREMAASGLIEFGSHSNHMHKEQDGRRGVLMKADESDADYRQALLDDMLPLNALLAENVGGASFFAYPYNQPQWQYYGFMTESLGYEVLLAGDSTVYSRTKGNCYARGTGTEELENRLVRRLARHSGADIETLLYNIWNDR